MPLLCAVRLQGHLHVCESSQEAAQAENLQPIYSDMLKQVTISTQGVLWWVFLFVGLVFWGLVCLFFWFKSLLTPRILQEYITGHY